MDREEEEPLDKNLPSSGGVSEKTTPRRDQRTSREAFSSPSKDDQPINQDTYPTTASILINLS